MSDLYLITGFLGAGKTTFLRNFVTLFQGEKIRLIINEFGQEGIDGTLLSDLQAMMQEISGGSVFCACRLDQFEAALQQCGRDEVIVVEASGLSDPTGVRKLFSQTDRYPHIRYMGGICLVDAVRFPKVRATVRSSIRQIAASDVVLLNKMDKATPEQAAATKELILDQRPDMPVVETSFGHLPEGFLELLAKSQNGDRQNLPEIMDLSTRKLRVELKNTITAYEVEKFIAMFAENTFRVKGLIQTSDKGLVLADCVSNVISVLPVSYVPTSEDTVGVLTILSGAKMPIVKSVKAACRWYEPYIVSSSV